MTPWGWWSRYKSVIIPRLEMEKLNLSRDKRLVPGHIGGFEFTWITFPCVFTCFFFFFLNVHSGHLGASTLNPLQLKEEISPLVLRLGERFFLLCCGCLILSVVGSWVELQSLVQVGHNIPEHSTVIRGPMSFREFAECYRSGPRNMKSCFPTPSSWGLHLRAARFCFKLTSGRA